MSFRKSLAAKLISTVGLGWWSSAISHGRNFFELRRIPSMLQSDRNAVGHIRDACRRITSFVGPVPVSDFHADHWCLSAVAYQLIIIGEATKSLSRAFRDDHHGIDW